MMSLKTIIQRWWQHFGFGIESRTDYDFLHEVIRERLPYYFYKDLRERFPEVSRHEYGNAKLFFRLGNFIRPTEVDFCGEPSEIYRFALLRTVCNKGDYEKKLLLYIQGEQGLEVKKKLLLASIIIVNGIDSVNEDVWQNILSLQHCITFDMQSVGIAIIDRKRFSEHYRI